MALAQIREIPSTSEGFSSWAFSHQAHHRDLNRVIFSKYGIRIDEYILDPFDPEGDMGPWLYQHQAMHNQQNAALNIQGYDLSSLDWQDKENVADWILKNYSEHEIAGTLLNLG